MPSQRPTPDVRALLALWLAVVVVSWGGNYAIVKLALSDAAPFTFNAIRFIGAAAIMGFALWLKGDRLVPEAGERWPLAVVGFCQVTVMLGLTSLGLQWIEASRAVLLAYTMSLWALLLGALLLDEPITRQGFFGAAVSFLGLCLLFNPLTMDWSTHEILVGSALALFGSIAWALGSTLYRRQSWRSTFWTQVFWQALIGSLPLLAAAIAFEWERPFAPTPRLLMLIVYNWLIPAGVAYWCWAKVLNSLTASFAGQILLLAPIFGVLLAHLIFDEAITWGLAGSGALILLGAWLAVSERPRRADRFAS